MFIVIYINFFSLHRIDLKLTTLPKIKAFSRDHWLQVPPSQKLGDKVGDNENRGTETPSFPCFFG